MITILKKVSFFMLFFVLHTSYGLCQSIHWAFSAGSAGTDNCRSLTTDATGNLYATGGFTDSVDFDAGPGFNQLVSEGSFDVFVLKLDPSGQTIWARSIGGHEEDQGLSIAVDQNHNTYVTGEFKGSVDFDPGPGIFLLNALGQKDAFILKLDGNGDFVWALRIGGAGDDSGRGLSLDANGYVYTTGSFSGQVDFDPGPGISLLTSAGGLDIYTAKYSSTGYLIWANNVGGVNNDAGNAIAIDTFGNIYTTGTFYDVADFDPGPVVYILGGANINDIFISKLDSAGDFVWAKNMGSPGSDHGISIAVADNGTVFTTGFFESSADFDPGIGSFTMVSSGGRDVFLSSLTPNGDFNWAVRVGSLYHDSGTGVALDAFGKVFVSGSFFSSVDFDSGPGVFTMNSSGAADAFIMRYDTTGVFEWATKVGGIGLDYGLALCAGWAGGFFMAGTFSNTAYFNPSATIFAASNGDTDMFIASYLPFGTNVPLISNAADVTVFPNPMSDAATISMASGHVPYKIYITNVSGQVIHKEIGLDNNIVLKRGDFEAGLYFLQIITGSATTTLKLLVTGR